MAFEFGVAQDCDVARASMIASAFRKQGKPVVLVVVGAGVHAGHCALIRAARRIPGSVVIVAAHDSVAQHDLAAERVDAVARYSDHSLWPHGLRGGVMVNDNGMEDPELLRVDASRILALVGAIGPSDLVLGEKDYELLVNVQQAVTDLHIPVTIHSVPTVRMPDGVAISLRNTMIPVEYREQALALAAAVTAGAHAAEAGQEAVCAVVREVLQASGVEPDFVKVTALNLGPAPQVGDARLFAGITLGGVRLTDNVGLPLGIGFKNIENPSA
ncbi:MAG: pantoate--beta-alanine ligase [Corynebacterium sp.]|uniref:pantoate--beta-alanine ligase n=1 Tax=Corynebacterium sp. TaxID=1720 RepID=UPI0026DCDA76|nr:pantoate--beta-alanine ligase [Corynebacterium sp.]MDO4762589.1 pantoate--beta-alanine ligase [Corynebacterium sp.]